MAITQNYPILEIDLGKFEDNLYAVKTRCSAAGVKCAGVVKGFWALPRMAELVQAAGYEQLATSRLSQIAAMREQGLSGPFMLIRIPALSEIKDVARLCDYSLQSQITTIQALNDECALAGRKHKVVIMADLGDLREGFWSKEMAVAACLHVERDLPMLELAGVGTNLGCYGAVRATREKMEELAMLAREVEDMIGRKLEIVSGGGSNEYSLIHKGELPEGINHLRVGEAITTPRMSFTDYGILEECRNYIHLDVFTLKAEVIEVDTKPSYPVGELGRDGFGGLPHFEDKGMRRRALLAIGKADVPPEMIFPRKKGVEVLGASSDHTILDVTDCEYAVKLGDVLEFDLNYVSMLSLTGDADVPKIYKE